MAKTRWLSLTAATLLVGASMTIVGCGSSDTVAVTPYEVTVSDAYVLGASVKSGTYAAVETGNGVYEFADETKVSATDPLIATGGVNDVDGDGVADAGGPYAPTMKAPAGYHNINAFTTLMVDGGLSATEVATLNALELGTLPASLDFDVVANTETNLPMAKAAAKLALYQAYAQNPSAQEVTPASSSSSSAASNSSTSSVVSSCAGGILPGDTDCASASSSVSSSSSSVASSIGGILPGDTDSRGILPGDTDTGAVSSVSSSVVSSSSSTGGILPGDTDTSSSSSSVTSSSSSSSTANSEPKDIGDIVTDMQAGKNCSQILPQLAATCTAIDNATSGSAIDDAVRDALGDATGTQPASSSSSVASSVASSSVASSVVSSSSTSSTTSSTGGTDCLPGQPCGSSSSVAISSTSSSVASSISSSVISSSSSSKSGGVLPGDTD